MRRRDFLLTSAAWLSASAFARGSAFARELRRDRLSFAQVNPAAAVGSAPANSWPQFRGSHALTGISSTTIAPAPKLAWAWEGGEAFDSSPAIVDDVVYAGTATGEVIAVGLADGKLFVMNRNQLYALQEGAQLKK